jgi:hypothetical protein
VAHKTSRFTRGEVDGFEAAADADGIELLELVTIGETMTKYRDAAHGFLFQHHERYAADVHAFLGDATSA